MYRFDEDETTPAPLMIPPDCNDLIQPALQWKPFAPTADDLEFMRVMEVLHKEIIEAFRISPQMLGELREQQREEHDMVWRVIQARKEMP